jgi:hypothetical protein
MTTMKLPQQQLTGAMRKHYKGRMERSPAPSHAAGIIPQDEGCENVCRDAYEAGSAEEEECLQSCWED